MSTQREKDLVAFDAWVRKQPDIYSRVQAEVGFLAGCEWVRMDPEPPRTLPDAIDAERAMDASKRDDHEPEVELKAGQPTREQALRDFFDWWDGTHDHHNRSPVDGWLAAVEYYGDFFVAGPGSEEEA